MITCHLCSQTITEKDRLFYKFGRPYCAKCSATFERVAAEIRAQPNGAAAAGPRWTAYGLGFHDILGIIAFCMALIGLVTGGFLCIVGFILSLFAIGRERYSFGSWVFFPAICLIMAAAAGALIWMLFAIISHF